MSVSNFGTVRPGFKLVLTACCILYVAHGQSSFLWVKKKYVFLRLHLFICLVVCLCDVGLCAHTWLRVCGSREQLGGWFYTSLCRPWRLNSAPEEMFVAKQTISMFPSVLSLHLDLPLSLLSVGKGTDNSVPPAGPEILSSPLALPSSFLGCCSLCLLEPLSSYHER